MTAYATGDLEPTSFDERVAPTYDAGSAHMFGQDVLGPTVDLLQELAGDGTALELAIGTGRVALPLAERGVEVHGIDASEAMVAQLRGKPGGDRIPVTIGDMATTAVGSGYAVAYLAYNTITNLLTQDEQVQCFRTVAEQLAPGGAFVIEVFVPQLRRMPPGQTAVPFHVGRRHVGFDTVDVVSQLSVSHHYTQAGEDAAGRRVATYATSAHRYVWPSELDLMARLAGLRLRDRWADWDRSPFTADSASHVSVWTTAAD
ncbi:class I SAM-dependent methyltransferase [Terrabacter aerolatus]|uniref:Methyltransferase n=1 Tax=Terrabacter aerolatus TaxID=422442 RepID=A0A512D6W4_9MICO|nr:class I SAM-dependent methyltransferase [Terrabacter aerolatus]GEO32218.1 methyltransferase [Terrabacter aerolatus]